MNPQSLQSRSKNIYASGRRQLLWNVSQPGDPYDIKKSMIAKMPGDKKVQMGSHIELVCLLQAAQIQRLCEFLQDYKLRFREIQRSSLDRHSYQVQIKELTQRLAEEETARTDHSKLVQFAKKQQAQIAYLHSIPREGSANEGLRQTYERSLELTNQLSIQNRDLREKVEQLLTQLHNANGRYQALEKTKNLEIQDLKNNFVVSSRESYESSLSSLRVQYQTQLRKWDFEVKRLKQLNEAKNAELNDMIYQRKELLAQLQAKPEEGSEELQRQIYEYQNKFVLFGQEIERLNIALRDYTSKLQDSQVRNRQLEFAVQKADLGKRDAQLRLRNANGENALLADQIRRLEIDIKRSGETKQMYDQYQSQIAELTARLKAESQASRRYREQSERLAFQISKVKVHDRQNSELRLQAEQLVACQRRLVQTENRVVVMSQELERLRQILKGKESELQKTKLVSIDGDQYKSKLKEMETSIVSKYEYQFSRVKSEYQQKVAEVMRKGTEISTRSQFFQSELDRAKEQLKQKNDELNRIQIRIVELQAQLNRGDHQEAKNLIRTYEVTNAALKRDNEELFVKVRSLGEADRKNIELQNRVSQFEKELDRVAHIASEKQDELSNLRKRLRDYENVSQRIDTDVRTKMAAYEQTIASIRAQNDEIRRRQSDLVAESNRKLSEAAVENERLVIALRKAVDERNQFEASLSRVNSTLQQAQNTSIRELQALRKKSTDYESKLTLLSQQFERLNLLLRNKNEECLQNQTKLRNVSIELETTRRQFKDYETNVRNTLEGEVSQKLNAYEQRVRSGDQSIQKLQSENEELRRRYTEMDNRYQQIYQESLKLKEIAQRESHYISVETQLKKKIALYQNNVVSLTRLNEQLQKKLVETDAAARQRGQDCSRLEAQLRNSMAENDGLRRQAKESQYSIAQRFESQISRRQSAYEQNMNKVAGQNDEIKRKLQQLIPDYERNKANYNLLTQENDVLKHKIESYETSINKYEAEVKHRFMTYEQEDQEKRRKIAQYQNKIAFLSQQQERLTLVIRQSNEDFKRKNSEYEQRLQALSQQLDRLNNAYRQKNDEFLRLEQNMKGINNENELYRKKIEQYQAHTGKIGMTFNQLQSRLSAAQQEIERSNQVLRAKQEQLSKQELQARNLAAEAENWKRKYSDLQANYSHTFEFEVNKKYGAYEQSIADLKRKGGEYETKLVGTTQEIERLNNVLRLKVEESVQQGARLSAVLSQLQENKRRVRQLEMANNQNSGALRKENDDLVRRLHELELNIRQNQQTNQRRIAEYENRIRALTQQGQRMAQTLKVKNDDFQTLKRQFKEYQDSVTMQIKTSHGQYESAVVTLRKENEDLKRNLNETAQRLVEYENKLALTSQQMERLKLLLKGRADELAKLDSALSGQTRQNEELRRRLQQVNEIGRKLAEYQVKMGQLVQENDKLQLALRNKTEELALCDSKLRQIQAQNDSFKKQLREYQFQFGRKVSAYEQGNAQLRREQQDAIKKRTEYESKIALLSQQLQRVTGQLRTKGEEFQSYKRTRQSQWEGEYQALQRNYTLVSEEAQTAKQHLIEYEQTLRKINGQIERLHGILHQLKKERDTLITKNRTLSQEIQRLNKINNDLEEQTRDIRLRLIDQTSLQTRISQHMALMTLRQRIRAKEIEVNTVRKESLAPNIV